jgi:hypothetical protein
VSFASISCIAVREEERGAASGSPINQVNFSAARSKVECCLGFAASHDMSDLIKVEELVQNAVVITPILKNASKRLWA